MRKRRHCFYFGRICTCLGSDRILNFQIDFFPRQFDAFSSDQRRRKNDAFTLPATLPHVMPLPAQNTWLDKRSTL